MNPTKYVSVFFLMLLLLGMAAYAAPTLTFSLNANEVIAGTAGGNQIITATCLSGETCKIIYASNSVVVGSSTTTNTINLNSIDTSGYVSLIAQNSIGTNSITNTIRVIAVTNSTSLTFNNIQPVAYPTGTTMELVISNFAFQPFETSCSDNNQVIYNSQGIVQTSWQAGSLANETNMSICKSYRDLVLLSSPAGFLAAQSTNTLTLGWAAPGTNLYDGNYICEAPQLSSTYAQYDCGTKVFQNYYNVNGILSSFTNNGLTLTQTANYLSITCPTGPQCSLLESAPATIADTNNGLLAAIAGKPDIGTTASNAVPDFDVNMSIDTSASCPSGNSKSTCINLGDAFTQGTNTMTYIYYYQNNLAQASNSSNIINVLKAQNVNPFGPTMLLDDCTSLNTCTGGAEPSPFPFISNTVWKVYPGIKGIVATNMSNLTYILSIAKQDNFSSKDVIWYDMENFTGTGGGAEFSYQYEVWYWNQTSKQFCNTVHAAGYLCGVYLSGDTPLASTPNGYSSYWREINSLPYKIFDYVNIQDQYYTGVGAGTGAVPGFSTFANVMIQNITEGNFYLRAGVEGIVFNASPASGTSGGPAYSNSLIASQMHNASKTLLGGLVSQEGLDYILGDYGCNTIGAGPVCSSRQISNSINQSKIATPYTINTVMPNLYTLEGFGSTAAHNTIEYYNNQYVMDAVGNGGEASTFFGLWLLNNGNTANVFWIGVMIPPPNGIQPTITLGEAGALSTPSLTANYPANNGHALQLYANWSGGNGPFTVNVIVSNAISGAIITHIAKSNINATYFNASGYTPTLGVQIKANVVITDANGRIVNSTYIWLPPQISVANSVTSVSTGNTVTFIAQTSGGALLYNTYNVVYTITNSVTGTTMNTMAFNGISWLSTNSYTFTIPSSWAGNTIKANVIFYGTYAGNLAGAQTGLTPTSIKLNSTKSATITIAASSYNAMTTPTLTLSNAVIDQGQSILFTASVTNGLSPYTYNFIITNTNGVVSKNPSIGIYVPTYASLAGGGYPTVMADANSVYINRVTLFQADFNTANQIFNWTLGLTTANINSIITEDTANDVPTIFALGGSNQYYGNWSVQACNNFNAQNALIANIILWLNGQSLSGSTKKASGFLLDMENTVPNSWCGMGGNEDGKGDSGFKNMSIFVNKLWTNMSATNSTWTLGFYAPVWNNVSYNWVSLSTNGIGYFDVADTQTAILSASYMNNFATKVGGQSKVIAEECLVGSGGGSGCDAIASPLAQIGVMIPAGFGMSFFTSADIPGTAVLKDVASNILALPSAENALFANALYTSVSSTSNSFFWTPAPNSYVGNTFVVNVTVTDSLPATVNSIQYNIGYNSALTNNRIAVSSNPIAKGATQTITANIAGGTSPYSYNIIIIASNGVIVYNSLSPRISSTSNIVSFTQNSAWGFGTFTANSYVTDSATTNVVLSNSITYSVTSTLASTSWTASNAVVDLDDYQVLNAILSGGTSPYTYNFLVYNAVGSLVTNALYSGISATSNSFTFQMQPTYSTGTYTANIIITDSVSGTISNTLTFTVDTALNANPPTPTTATIDNGLSITLTANPTGGTPPYSVYQWYTDSNNNCASLSIIVGATSSTYLASPTANTFYCYIVKDSTTIPTAATSSAPANIIVNRAYSFNSFTSSPILSNSIDIGQSIAFTANIAGGTSPYTYNFILANTVTGSILANQLYAGVTGTSNTFTWTPPSSAVGNTLMANVLITDSASSAQSVNSLYLTTLTINAALGVPTLSSSPSSGTIIGGNTITYSSSWSGGTSTYTANYIVFNSITKAIVTSQLYSGITGTSNAFTYTVPTSQIGNTLAANVVVTDSAATPTSANSVATAALTVIGVTPSPIITLGNSTSTSNMIDVIAASASDNGNITATCGTGDTCQIWYNGASHKSGTTTAVLGYNSLPLGYTSVYANDITATVVSSNSLVRRITADSVQITFTNFQNTAVAANTPIFFSFNALQYTAQESTTLNNIVISFTNGTVAYSWLEGNVLNELQQANTLYTSANVLFWYKSPPSNAFLGAGGSNKIILSFSANGVLDGNYIGEAPQLSCNNPSNTITGCTAGQYGKYDNGASIFTNYQNFAGTSTPSGWTIGGYSNPSIDNGVNVSSENAGGNPSYIISNWATPNNLVSEELVTSQSLNSVYPYNNGQLMFLVSSSASNAFNFVPNSVGYQNAVNALLIESNNGGAPTIVGQASSTKSFPPAVVSVYGNTLYYNYALANVISGNILGTGYLTALVNTGSITNGTFQYVRQRISPPNGVMPSASFPAITSVSISQPSNTVVDVGQYEIFTATIFNGISGPYTYNFIISNSVTDMLVYSNSASNALTSNTLAFQIPSYFTANSPLQANVVVTDAGSNTYFSGYSSTFTVNGALSANTLLASNTAIDIGQHSTLTAGATGGIPSYNINWFSQASCAGSSAGAGTSLSVSPTSTTTYSFNVVDSASNPSVVCSASNTITVHSTPALSIPIPSNMILDSGQSVTYNTILSGGTGTFTVNLIVSGSVVNSLTGQSAGTLTFGSNIPAVGSISFNVMATDLGTTTPYVFASSANIITVYQLPTSKITFVGGNAILFGSNAISNDIITGGSGNFLWTWTKNNVGIANAVLSSTQTSNTNVYPVVGTYTYNVAFTDIGTTTHYSGSQVSNVLVVSQNGQPSNVLGFTLTPSYSYNSPMDHYLGITANQIFNLLNYSYTLNSVSYYGINSIKVNFGTNTLTSGNSITFSANQPMGISNTLWNTYQSNGITSYNVVVTITDIYGDLLQNTIILTTNAYVYPQISAPQIFINPSSAQTYTYTNIYTPLQTNAIKGSFNLANATFYPYGNSIAVIRSGTSPTLVYYQYPTNTAAGALTINNIDTDINGFSSAIATTTGDSVLNYNTASVTITNNAANANVNTEFLFSLVSGTFATQTINIFWGDGTNTILSFSPATTSNSFTAAHTYSLPEIYVPSVYVTDNSPNGGITSSVLTNPNIVVGSYVPPVVVSVSPSNRFNGANNNTENFTFYLQEGSNPLKNLTINWNDGVPSLDRNSTTTFTTLTGAQLSYSVVHNFYLPTAYQTNVTICDTNKVCVTYATPITIGNPPLSQNSIGAVYNRTATAANQLALNESGDVQTNVNPTQTIAIGAVIVVVVLIAAIYIFRKRTAVRHKT